MTADEERALARWRIGGTIVVPSLRMAVVRHDLRKWRWRGTRHSLFGTSHSIVHGHKQWWLLGLLIVTRYERWSWEGAIRMFARPEPTADELRANADRILELLRSHSTKPVPARSPFPPLWLVLLGLALSCAAWWMGHGAS